VYSEEATMPPPPSDQFMVAGTEIG
jgi:hypothetical protein